MASARRAAVNQSNNNTSRSLRRSLLLFNNGGGRDIDSSDNDDRTNNIGNTSMNRIDTRDSIDVQATESDPLLAAEAGFLSTDQQLHGNLGERDTPYDSNTFTASAAADLPRKCSQESIFPLLQRVRDDVRATIDTHLDWNELTAIDVNYAVVRPLAMKYNQRTTQGQKGERYPNLSILFVFLVNRIQFQRDAERDLALQNVNNTRANLCELLAMKLLRTFARDGLQLITALTFPFSTFQGANEEILSSEGMLDKHTGEPIFGPAQSSSALELAIMSKAKKFIKSPLCQRCIAGIYEGRVVVSYQSAHAIIDDSYKKRPLGLYNPATAPFLDHHRLRVPLIRSRIEFFNFGILLLLYVWCLAQKKAPDWTSAETIFTIWLCGFALEEVTQMQEHGLSMYLSSLYNVLDLMFCVISFIWFGIRVAALSQGDLDKSSLSFETLALGAILLCPRVASVLVQDNVILLALKAMLSDFVFFMLLAAVCFSGFLYTFWALSGPEWTAGRILWIMIKVWFGNSYVGFDTAQSLSPIFGPPLMVFFAVMANTLLLTILISLLSNTFSIVAQNAMEEAMYQFACKTVSGISSEALMSYAPPLNLLALMIMVPASFFLSPRYLHKANVYLLRATSWPILLLIRFSTHYWPSGLTKLSVTSYVLGTSNSERAGYLISWLPLPRSKSQIDRDMIQAAFMHSSSLATKSAGHLTNDLAARSNEGTIGDYGGTIVDQNIEDVELPNENRGNDRSLSSTANDPNHTTDFGSISPATPAKSKAYQSSTARIRESPLARLFGRALRNNNNDTINFPAEERIEERDDGNLVKGKKQTKPDTSDSNLIDLDCANVDQVGASDGGKDGLPSASQTNDILTSQDSQNNSESLQDDDALQEQASVYGLVRSLTRRMDEQEKRQKRIEELLQMIVKNQEQSK